MATKLVNKHAAGIDISSKEYVVAVPEDRCENSIRSFGAFTCDLHKIAKWLQECKITTIAMESTGVYWYHLYTVLLDYDFQVYLVNAHHVKNVAGRKSDINDARWLQELHTFGLLKGSFQPDNLTRSLRTYVRERKNVIQEMTRATQHMQKALEQMNIKLNNVLRNITGLTGIKIITQILAGERCAEMLAKNREKNVRASEQTLIKSLEGNWREEQLFNLQLAFDHYNFLLSQLPKIDAAWEKVIKKFAVVSAQKATSVQKSKNNPTFNVSQYLYNVLGVEVTKVYGIKEITALTIYSETGPNLKAKFPAEKQFLSWLNVVPDNKITGGKIIYSKVKRKKNKAGQAFRDAASALWRAQNPMGDYLRRKKAKNGARQAVVATARKIAAIYYKMVTQKVEFDPAYEKLKTKVFLENKLKDIERLKNSIESQLADYQDAVA